MKLKVNDYVRILSEPKGSINERARVDRIVDNGVYVCNSNMPFYGTLYNVFFKFDEIEKVGR